MASCATSSVFGRRHAPALARAAVAAGADALLLTPAHQYPRGVVLGARNRSAFADWARREDGFIVEDDYDGEFRYDQQPVGAMQAPDGSPIAVRGAVMTGEAAVTVGAAIGGVGVGVGVGCVGGLSLPQALAAAASTATPSSVATSGSASTSVVTVAALSRPSPRANSTYATAVGSRPR